MALRIFIAAINIMLEIKSGVKYFFRIGKGSPYRNRLPAWNTNVDTAHARTS